MKLSTLALALGTAALLVGCGGGGSSSSGGTGGGSSSSTGGSSSSTGGSSSSTAGGNSSPVSSLTINSVNDIRGYTLKSNDSHQGSGQYTTTTVFSISVDCSGHFKYQNDISMAGNTNTTVIEGTEITHWTDVEPQSLTFTGVYTKVDGFGDQNLGDTSSIGLDLEKNTHEFVAGQTCWMGDGHSHGEDCPNNLYIKTITQDEVCQ